MRLTKKTKLFRGYTRDFAISNVIDEMTYKLGQLEDILEKYNIENNDELEILCKYAERVKEWMSIYEEKMLEIRRIEEELGIDLITLFKALKNGFYYKLKEEIVFIEQGYEFNLRGKYIHLGCSLKKLKIKINEMLDTIILLKDYGKTWALTKEELE